MKDKKINRGTQCNKYDEYGVPIPAYLEGFEGTGGLTSGPLSLELGDSEPVESGRGEY